MIDYGAVESLQTHFCLALTAAFHNNDFGKSEMLQLPSDRSEAAGMLVLHILLLLVLICAYFSIRRGNWFGVNLVPTDRREEF